MAKKPVVPPVRSETVRQELLRLLDGETLLIGELSKELRMPEKEVFYYLDRLQAVGELVIVPAECGACGYQFKDRKKAKKPSKCPRCRSSYIRQPGYTLKR